MPAAMTREEAQAKGCQMDGISTSYPHKGSPLPLMLCADHAQDINGIDEATQQFIVSAVESVGAVLLRGFKVTSPFAFRKFATSFGEPLVNSYNYGSTPRSKVSPGVYTSTEYPAHSTIPMHNEQAYTRQWPSRLWFHCMKASESGGETPLVDSRAMFNEIPERIREAFLTKGLMDVRNFSPMMDVPWQQAFNTDSRQEVERFCASQEIEWEWKDGDAWGWKK